MKDKCHRPVDCVLRVGEDELKVQLFYSRRSYSGLLDLWPGVISNAEQVWRSVAMAAGMSIKNAHYESISFGVCARLLRGNAEQILEATLCMTMALASEDFSLSFC